MFICSSYFGKAPYMPLAAVIDLLAAAADSLVLYACHTLGDSHLAELSIRDQIHNFHCYTLCIIYGLLYFAICS